jgi:hypothetical protein
MLTSLCFLDIRQTAEAILRRNSQKGKVDQAKLATSCLSTGYQNQSLTRIPAFRARARTISRRNSQMRREQLAKFYPVAVGARTACTRHLCNENDTNSGLRQLLTRNNRPGQGV